MTWAKTNNLMDPAIILLAGTPNTFTSSALTSQRVRDHRGIIQCTFGANPGTVTGLVYIEARLNPNQPWAQVYEGGTTSSERVQADGGDFYTKGRSFGNPDIPVLPQMRASSTDLNPTNEVPFTLWIME